MITVYRYEKEGIGPYQYSSPKYYPYLDKMADEHACNYNYPCIGTDSKGLSTMQHLCACNSLEDLKRWFYGYNTHLKRYGFKIYQYEVHKINETYSGKQCEFHKDDVISKQIIK